MRGNAVRWPVAALMTCALLGLGGTGAAAQPVTPVRDFLSSPRFGVGYSGALPEALAGASAWYMTGPRRLGAFADFKMTVPRPTSHRNYCPPRLQECSIRWVQVNEPLHFQGQDENEWLAFNAGGIYAFSGEFALMLGGGAARLMQVRQFIDDEDEFSARITPEGTYYVPHDPASQWTGQAVIGLLLRAGNRLAFSFGHETGIGGMTVGLYLTLP